MNKNNPIDERSELTALPVSKMNRRKQVITIRHSICATMTLMFFAMLSGCEGDVLNAGKMLPAPLRYDFPYTIEKATGARWWGSDNFDVNVDEVVHYIVIRGLIAPKPGQLYSGKARVAALKYCRGKELEIQVQRHDDSKREIGDVFLNGENLGLKFVRDGLAWYDGSQFEGCEQYQAAEEEARENEAGLWSEPDPIHPAEFMEQQQRQRGLIQ